MPRGTCPSLPPLPSGVPPVPSPYTPSRGAVTNQEANEKLIRQLCQQLMIMAKSLKKDSLHVFNYGN